MPAQHWKKKNENYIWTSTPRPDPSGPHLLILTMSLLQRLTGSLHDSYTSSISPFTINRSFTSWLLPSAFFAILRLLISLYCFIVLFYAIGWQSGLGEDEKVQQSFSYFTVLGYWGLAFYFAFAAVQTGSVVWKEDGEAWLVSWPRGLRGLFAVFAGSVTVFPLVVTGEFRLRLRDE